MSTATIKPNKIREGVKDNEVLARISLCFQCKKCSCGCPVTFAMDLLPHQVMRLAQLGLEEGILKTNTPWVCASCEACTTRCPNDIDIAAVMDELRKLAVETNCVSEKNVLRFHKVFLKEVEKMGRLHELSMIGGYKLLSKEFFKDTVLGIKMFMKGKMKILPSWIKGRKELKRLFKKAGRKK